MTDSSPTNDDNGFMVYFLRFNTGGLDKSSPTEDESSPYTIGYFPLISW